MLNYIALLKVITESCDGWLVVPLDTKITKKLYVKPKEYILATSFGSLKGFIRYTVHNMFLNKNNYR